MNRAKFHEPVLVASVLQYLIHNPSGIYVDGTVGGAGHSVHIVKKLTGEGRLIGIDCDEQALQWAHQVLKSYGDRIQLRQGNFAHLGAILNSLHLKRVDGIFLDLGVSSYQIETSDRGFSYLKSGPLDMRMSQTTELTAREIVNRYPKTKLEQIFKEYGEERHAHSIANAIVWQRQKTPLTMTEQLREIIESAVPFPYRIKSVARIFQSLRIVVNQELENLQLFLNQSSDLLNPKGRLVIIAYHSLEDRLVKDFLLKQANPCECPPDFPVCGCGKRAQLRLLIRKAVKASDEERKMNPRSRSARLRAAEKI